MSTTAIVSKAETSYLEIVSSQFRDIGTWYSSSTRRFFAYNPIYVPMVLKADNILIQDSIFAYVSPYQFELFDATGLFEGVLRDYTLNPQSIALINNIFEINDENVLYPYPSNETLHFWDDLQLFMIYRDSELVSSVEQLVSQHFIVNGIIVIPSNIQLKMINNKFSVNPNNLYVNESTFIEYNMPWIYVEQDVNDTDTIICMNGNEFTNFAISLNQGNITSCVKNDILNYIHDDDCDTYGTFGSIYQYAFNYNQGEPNIFNVHYSYLNTIIEGLENTYLALDNNVINVFDDGSNIFNIQQGNYLFVDTMINGSDLYNIFINTECTVLLFRIAK